MRTRAEPPTAPSSLLCTHVATHLPSSLAPRAVVRSSALNPLYEGLPVLVVPDWSHVTPNLLRSFLVNYTVRKPLYRYEKLFADYWVGQFGVQRERCLAEERARHAPQYVYDYKQRGGWVAVDGSGRKKPTPVWTRDAVKGG